MIDRNYIESQGLTRWANTDPALHVNVFHEADRSAWKADYLAALKAGDYATAHELRLRHDRQYRKEQGR